MRVPMLKMNGMRRAYMYNQTTNVKNICAKNGAKIAFWLIATGSGFPASLLLALRAGLLDQAVDDRELRREIAVGIVGDRPRVFAVDDDPWDGLHHVRGRELIAARDVCAHAEGVVSSGEL